MAIAEKSTKQLALTKEQLLAPTTWEPTGKSPGNTPQAKLQAAQMLLQATANPTLAPYINVPALLQVIVSDSPLQNAKNVVRSEPLAPQPQQPPGLPPPPGIPPQQGGGPTPELPGVPPIEGPAGLPDVGPGQIQIPNLPGPGTPPVT